MPMFDIDNIESSWLMKNHLFDYDRVSYPILEN
jgi:hypothetical protein